MTRPEKLHRFGVIAGASAVAAMAALSAGCTPTTERPADPTGVAPTEKGVVGAQTGTHATSKPHQAPTGTAQTVLPDGTLNRSGGRPDTNDNGSWQMSVAPPTKPTPTCSGGDEICVTGD